MNRTLLLSLKGAFLCIIFIQWSACHKIDILHPDKLPKYCKIKTITNLGDDGTVWTFAYNKFGDPVRITNNKSGSLFPEHQFWYDNQRRLKDYIGIDAANNRYAYWHTYALQNGKIVRDTLRYGGAFVNGIPDRNVSAGSTYIIHFDYDSYGRMTGSHWFLEHGVPGGGPAWGSRYTYNPQGNIATVDRYDGSLSNITNLSGYDNKTSLYRTHPVWMFIAQDYSANNLNPATIYNNRYGLPLAFGEQVHYKRFLDLLINLANSTIEYECR